MFKKILIGFVAVAVAIALAGSGYQFGKYMAQNEKANAVQAAAAGDAS